MVGMALTARQTSVILCQRKSGDFSAFLVVNEGCFRCDRSVREEFCSSKRKIEKTQKNMTHFLIIWYYYV